MIHTYKTRREILRRKYGITDLFHSGKLPPGYTKRAYKLQKQIRNYKEIIKRLDKVWDKIFLLEKVVVAFTGQKIKYTFRQNDKELRIAKYLYYKFGLENGIRGLELRQYLGVPYSNRFQPLKFRARFTKSFQSVPENKELWIRFKRFYEQSVKDAVFSEGNTAATHYTKKKK